MSRTRALLLAAALLTAAFAAQAEERLADERIILHTQAGDIVIYLYPDVAPEHVKQMVKLVRMGVYDGTHFWRVDPNFLIQLATADDRSTPLSVEQKAAIHPLKAEHSKLKHRRGSVNMARADDNVDTGETSFCIFVVDAPHLDGKYTVFGHVDEPSMAVVDNILKVQRNGTQPVKRVEVAKATVATAAELAAMQLRPAAPLNVVPLSVPKELVLMIGLLVVVSLVSFLLAGRQKHQGLLVLSIAHIVLAAGAVGLTIVSASDEKYQDDPGAYWDNYPAAKAVAVGSGLMAGVGVLGLALGKRMGAKIGFSMNLLNTLVGVFLLFMVFGPVAYQQQTLALGVLIAMLTIFKLMSGFESPT